MQEKEGDLASEGLGILSFICYEQISLCLKMSLRDVAGRGQREEDA